MVLIKEEVHRMIDGLPDSTTYHDFEYELYVRRNIERGLADVEAGRVVSHEEAKQRLAKWLEP